LILVGEANLENSATYSCLQFTAIDMIKIGEFKGCWRKFRKTVW